MSTPQPPEGTTPTQGAVSAPQAAPSPARPSFDTLAPLALPGYRLAELHLYNWGAFAGRHQVSVDVGNTAIIGPTGSGKTTLIDAMMTLLCATPRYNLASTGGHESDRDLVSYVRGATGPGHAGDDSNHLARTGRCVTAMAARLVRGTHAQVQAKAQAGDVSATGGAEGADDDKDAVLIGCLLWFEGSSSSVADLTRRWFFARGTGHNLDLWLEEHHRGGARALSQLVKNTDGLQMFNSKSAYLARLQGFFEVGPMAFTLLNRAAGLKQLNSIDEIFRDLVLDDHAAHDDALQVAASFDELATIHAELELANHQYTALLPLRDMALQEQHLHLRLHQWRSLHAALPHWFATQGARLWEARCTGLQAHLSQHQQGMATARTALDTARAHEQHLHGLYLRTGGGDIQMLEQHLLTQKAVVAQKQSHLADCHLLLRNLGLSGSGPLNAALLARHQQQAETALQQLQTAQAALQATTEEAVAAERNANADVQRLQTELDAVRKRPGSNLPPAFPAFRAALAEQLNLPPDDLPFVAELVEVQKNQQTWRGAIERALGSQRLRILVPPHAMAPALRWVNQRHNHLHVRLLEATEPIRQEAFWADGFCIKLNLKPHPLQAALRQLLREQDRHCVDSPEALRHTPHAMTQQGLMSGKAQQFDKQDHKHLDQDWMTGFDNRDRLAHLTQQIKERTQAWQTLDQAKKAAQATQATATAQLSLWQRLLTLRFEDLDVPAAHTLLQQLQAKLDALLNPQSDTAQAKARWEAASHEVKQADDTLRGLETQHAKAQEAHAQAQKKQQECATRVAEHAAATASLSSTTLALAAATTLNPMATATASEADTLLPLLMPAFDPTALTCDTLDTQERQSLALAHQHVQTLGAQQANLHKDIIRQMGRAQKEDRGALAEQTQEVEALAHYLERLRVLEEEDLPAKRAQFQAYLNNASEQGVSTLLRGIDAQVAEISERIADLNRTLQRVDFQPGRTLQLDPQPVVHPVLQDLNKSMARLRSERLRDDGGTSHYQALQAMVQLLREHATNRRSKAAQALLDARYRLQFAVHVIDRETGQVLERRTGSQGGSGGEKEIIASYVLTASLSYALCPPGRKAPLFGTIVLDEAFSKSSAAVAARIIQALREFGLHALFVTPNKELRLLRNHTRSAVLVHRRAAQATLACLSWEELNTHANQRKTSSEISP